MNDQLIDTVAYWLAAAFARGVYDESGPYPEREREIKDYADGNWRQWLAAARACVSIGANPISTVANVDA